MSDEVQDWKDTIVDMTGGSRGPRRTRLLVEVFRGLAVIWFIFAAGMTGALVYYCATADVGVWGFVVAGLIALFGAFWTLFLWAFLLLCSSIAGYLGERTQFVVDGR